MPLLKTFFRQIDIHCRGLLRFLDEAMQQDHLPALYREEGPRDPVVQGRSHLQIAPRK